MIGHQCGSVSLLVVTAAIPLLAGHRLTESQRRRWWVRPALPATASRCRLRSWCGRSPVASDGLSAPADLPVTDLQSHRVAVCGLAGLVDRLAVARLAVGWGRRRGDRCRGRAVAKGGTGVCESQSLVGPESDGLGGTGLQRSELWQAQSHRVREGQSGGVGEWYRWEVAVPLRCSFVALRTASLPVVSRVGAVSSRNEGGR